eukprot:636495-Pelagomonas_calceolata.AAC.1
MGPTYGSSPRLAYPFPRQRVAIYCLLAYLGAHCTIVGPEKGVQCVAGRKVSTPYFTQATVGPHLNFNRRVVLGSSHGDVLRSPGDAAFAKRCHFLHWLAHPS